MNPRHCGGFEQCLTIRLIFKRDPFWRERPKEEALAVRRSNRTNARETRKGRTSGARFRSASGRRHFRGTGHPLPDDERREHYGSRVTPA
jgi:hypothetical protein